MNEILQLSNENVYRSEQERLEMINNAAKAYGQFLDALKIDWKNDTNANNTPMRVAKAYVNDLVRGCYCESPNITSFDNIGSYYGAVFEGGIPFNSLCAHHCLGFSGVAHISYLPGSQIIGLSKLNRILDHYARRFQVQENLCTQVHDAVNSMCKDNKGVAVMISAQHTCVSCRGIGHMGCAMKTSKLSGDFMNDAATRAEFYSFIADMKK